MTDDSRYECIQLNAIVINDQPVNDLDQSLERSSSDELLAEAEAEVGDVADDHAYFGPLQAIDLSFVDDMVAQAAEPISIADQWALELQVISAQISDGAEPISTFVDLSFLGAAN